MITKLFEYIALWNLNVGDYVLIELMYEFRPNEYKKGKITSLNKENGVNFPIRVETEDGDINTYQPNNIVRLLTDEESKPMRIKEEQEKYNL